MTDLKECLSCHLEIENNNDAIACDGACDKYIHIDCTHIEKKYVPIFNKYDNAIYVCDDCQRNGLKTINNKVNGLYQQLLRIQQKWEERDKLFETISKTVKETNEYVKKLSTEKVEKNQVIAVAPKEPQRKREQKTNTNANVNNNQKSNKQAAVASNSGGGVGTATTTKRNTQKATETATKKKQQTNSKRTPTESRDRTNTNANNTNKANTNVSKKEKKQQNETDTVNKRSNNENDEIVKTVIIKPKQSQSSDTTLNDITAKIKPSEVKFTNVSKKSNGCVVIVCENANECNKLKNKIGAELSEKVEIKSPELFKPMIKIFNVEKTLITDSLCAQLKDSNQALMNGELKIIKIVDDRNNADMVHCILEIDSASFNKVMIIFAQHDQTECEATEKCCANCQRANEKLNIEMDTNHDVWSNKCEILKRKRNQAIKKVDYANK